MEPAGPHPASQEARETGQTHPVEIGIRPQDGKSCPRSRASSVGISLSGGHMKLGWRLVAKLGADAPHFPHILSDPHGWALRLGPNDHADMKYFSSFPNVLAGLVEHLVRRRLGA